MENVRLSERSSHMRNKSWACCLRPLGQSDLDMDYNNVAVMENVRLAERSKAVSLSLTLIEIEGSNPSPDKNLHFIASLLLFNNLQSPKMKYLKVIHIKRDRTQEQYKGLVAEHWRGKYTAKTTLLEYAFLVCNRFKRIQTVSNGIMSQPTGDKNYARAL